MADKARNGIVVTVFSTASAVGKTMLAVNLTAELARQGFRACVIDLDLQFGDVANFLQIQPAWTIFEAQKAIGLANGIFDATAYITPYEYEGTAFSVLAAPSRLEDAYNVVPKNVSKVISELRHMYDYIIIDTTSAFSELNLMVMKMSTLVLAVSIVDFIPTIKNMKMGVDALKKIGFEMNKVRFILNRSNAKTNIEVKDVESLIDATFYHVLPNDFKSAVESIHSGIPIVLNRTKNQEGLGQSLRELAEKYTNRMGPVKTTKTPEQSSWLAGLFKR